MRRLPELVCCENREHPGLESGIALNETGIVSEGALLIVIVVSLAGAARPMKMASTSVVLCAVAALGCADPLDPSRLVDVSVTTDRNVVSATQPVQVTVTVVNRSSVLVKTGAPESYCYPPAFVVLDATLRERKPTPRVCLAIAYLPKTLLPGESIVIHDRWSGETADSNGNLIRLSPGKYFLKGRAWTNNGYANGRAITITVE